MARRIVFEKSPQPEKPPWKSWTFIFNLGLLLVSSWPEIASLLGEYQGTEPFIYHVGKAIAVLGIFLRYKTNGPIGGGTAVLSYGAKVGTQKAVGGLKKGLSILPGVNLK